MVTVTHFRKILASSIFTTVLFLSSSLIAMERDQSEDSSSLSRLRDINNPHTPSSQLLFQKDDITDFIDSTLASDLRGAARTIILNNHVSYLYPTGTSQENDMGTIRINNLRHRMLESRLTQPEMREELTLDILNYLYFGKEPSEEIYFKGAFYGFCGELAKSGFKTAMSKTPLVKKMDELRRRHLHVNRPKENVGNYNVPLNQRSFHREEIVNFMRSSVARDLRGAARTIIFTNHMSYLYPHGSSSSEDNATRQVKNHQHHMLESRLTRPEMREELTLDILNYLYFGKEPSEKIYFKGAFQGLRKKLAEEGFTPHRLGIKSPVPR